MIDNGTGEGDEELFGRVIEASADDLFRRVYRRGGYTTEDLENHQRTNRSKKDTALTFCGIFLMGIGALVVAVLICAATLFILFMGKEYYTYLLENKDKLFALLEYIASHAVVGIFSAAPFVVLWLRPPAK